MPLCEPPEAAMFITSINMKQLDGEDALMIYM